MRIHLLVLNYNGRGLLEECLPSVIEAGRRSRHACEVVVIDNGSTDDSVAWLAQRHRQVEVIRCPNRGLCSFNEVVPRLPGPVALLLNNDIKLDRWAVDLLVEPLVGEPAGAERPCFMTAPLCWLFDGVTYEGFRTAVRWRWGLVQATALYPGHEPMIRRQGLTASAGAALAVDRDKFVSLGGFDPLYLPGRLEDLDFAYRGYQAGYRAVYVPEATARHRGMATFGRVYGDSGCDELALRNTLLFQWKNLRHPAHLARQLVGLPLRLAMELLRAPWTPPARRWRFARALTGAMARRRQQPSDTLGTGDLRREREFFHQFHPRGMSHV
jgi:GT2 family glycosyltransferase